MTNRGGQQFNSPCCKSSETPRPRLRQHCSASQMVMPSGPKRAVTVAPFPSARYLKFRSRTFAAASTMAKVIRASSAVGYRLATASRVSPANFTRHTATKADAGLRAVGADASGASHGLPARPATGGWPFSIGGLSFENGGGRARRVSRTGKRDEG